MANRAQYEAYRDVIHYTAAQMELLRDSVGWLNIIFKKCAIQPVTAIRKQNAFPARQPAYDNRHYLKAHNAYDSLNLNEPAIQNLAPSIKQSAPGKIFCARS